jgi:hypothetical protein
MGHRDLKTTQIYADYMAGEREAQLVDAAFGGQLVANSCNTAQPDSLETPGNTEDLRSPTKPDRVRIPVAVSRHCRGL